MAAYHRVSLIGVSYRRDLGTAHPNSRPSLAQLLPNFVRTLYVTDRSREQKMAARNNEAAPHDELTMAQVFARAMQGASEVMSRGFRSLHSLRAITVGVIKARFCKR